MVCMVGYSATMGILPFVVEKIFDDVFARKDQGALYYLPFVIIAVFAFRGFMNFGQSFLTEYVGLRIITDVRNAINCHLQFLPLSFFQRHPTGTLISRVNNDVGLIRLGLTDAAASLLRDSTSLLALMDRGLPKGLGSSHHCLCGVSRVGVTYSAHHQEYKAIYKAWAN